MPRTDPNHATAKSVLTGRGIPQYARRLAGLIALGMLLLVIHGIDRRPAPPIQGRLRNISPGSVQPQSLRIATFNIHSGIGRDGCRNLGRVAECLKDFDLVGLNEVRGATLLFGQDQAVQVSRELHLKALFAPSEWQWWHGHFGNALLFNAPCIDWRCAPLPGTQGKAYRNLMIAEIPWQSVMLHVLVTHLDRHQDRAPQLKQAIAQFLSLRPPAILLGDLNSTCDDPQLANLIARPGIIDAVAQSSTDADRSRIDWIIARGLEITASGVRDIGASDHSCYWAEVRLPAERLAHPPRMNVPLR